MKLSAPAMKLLTDKQVAEQLGVTREYVWRLCKRGFPQPVHIPPRLKRWVQEDVDNWIADLQRQAQQTETHQASAPALSTSTTE